MFHIKYVIEFDGFECEELLQRYQENDFILDDKIIDICNQSMKDNFP